MEWENHSPKPGSAISAYIQWLWGNARGEESTERGRLVREAWSLEQELGAAGLSEGQVVEDRSQDGERQNNMQVLADNDIRRHGTASVVHREQPWESPSISIAADDPLTLPDVEAKAELGRDFFLD